MKSSLALLALRVIPNRKQLAMLARAFNYLLNSSQIESYSHKVVRIGIKGTKNSWSLEFDGFEFIPSVQEPSISVLVDFEDVLNFPSPEEIKDKIRTEDIQVIGQPQDEKFIFELLDSIDQIKVTQCIRHLRGLVGYKSQDIKDKELSEVNIRDIASQKDVDYIRDNALKVENTDPALAYKLMKLAHGARPQGPFIKRKLNQYKQKGYGKLNAFADQKPLLAISVAEKQLCYFPVPKSACSSIKLALYEQIHSRSYDSERYDGIHIHDYWVKRTQRMDSFSQSLIVVRDPIERFLSAYSSRVLDHSEINRNAIKKDCSWLLNTLPHFRPNLSQFIRHLDLYMLVPSIEHHCQPLSWQVNNDLSAFSHVVPIQKIDDAEKLLQAATESSLKIPKAHVGKNKVALGDLSHEQLEMLLDFYADDYRLLTPWYKAEDICRKWEIARGELAKAGK